MVGASRGAGCAVGAAFILILGCDSLQNAVANGDTRTISFHHLHTGEDLTVTYKIDGRYDEQALQKINWELRDWRRNEATRMDPHVIDVVWEVYREVGGKEPIEIICGYRAPATNAMLRRRSSGVAKFSQHTLGKAIDLHIPGISLEKQREAGLRLQRGGVGYYPSSGSPFVHLDTGNVRHWPRIAPDQLARIMRKGPIQVASADSDKPQRGIIASLFGGGRDEEEETPSVQARMQPARSSTTTVVATVPAKSETKHPAPTKVADARSRPASRAAVAAARPAAAAQPAESVVAARGYWGPTADEVLAQPQEPVKTASAGDLILAREAPRPEAEDRTASLGAFPLRDGGTNDRVPPEIALAYAAQADAPVARNVTRASPMGSLVDRARVAAEQQAAEQQGDVASLKVVKKTAARLPSGKDSAPARLEPARAAAAAPVTPGTRFDDPWLRAVLLAPSLQTSMTTTVYGDPDLGELAALMRKPAATVIMTFCDDPLNGLEAERFSGDAVVFLSTVTFIGRTAALQ
jgi:uncharacterized protein YcbK (DUF882 family)